MGWSVMASLGRQCLRSSRNHRHALEWKWWKAEERAWEKAKEYRVSRGQGELSTSRNEFVVDRKSGWLHIKEGFEHYPEKCRLNFYASECQEFQALITQMKFP